MSTDCSQRNDAWWRDRFAYEQSPSRPRWRVTVYINGEPHFYNDYVLEELADSWANDMRRLFIQNSVTGVFIQKTSLTPELA